MAKKTVPTFDEFHSGSYGDRWPSLREALLGEVRYETLEEGLLAPYHLDAASAARALGVVPGDRVLDMCAAPGGKTLVLALALAGTGELVSNELSDARRARLSRVLDEHLPEALRATVRVTGRDATRWGLHEPGAYDRILVDAPCSSDRHLLGKPELLKEWTPARPKQLAFRQHALLCAGFDALRPGGKLAYCTCALSPCENDGVVEKLLKSRKGKVEILAAEIPDTEPTEFGRIALPDCAAGSGPLYCALIGKKAG